MISIDYKFVSATEIHDSFTLLIFILNIFKYFYNIVTNISLTVHKNA